jgi:hypothetical protein
MKIWPARRSATRFERCVHHQNKRSRAPPAKRVLYWTRVPRNKSPAGQLIARAASERSVLNGTTPFARNALPHTNQRVLLFVSSHHWLIVHTSKDIFAHTEYNSPIFIWIRFLIHKYYHFLIEYHTFEIKLPFYPMIKKWEVSCRR